MDKYVGLDAHVVSCTLGVVESSGKRVGSHVVETNARALIEVPRGRLLIVRDLMTVRDWYRTR